MCLQFTATGTRPLPLSASIMNSVLGCMLLLNLAGFPNKWSENNPRFFVWIFFVFSDHDPLFNLIGKAQKCNKTIIDLETVTVLLPTRIQCLIICYVFPTE